MGKRKKKAQSPTFDREKADRAFQAVMANMHGEYFLRRLAESSPLLFLQPETPMRRFQRSRDATGVVM